MNTWDIFETPHDCPPERVFVLTAYLDETGHEGRSLMILAGFLGNSDQWKACEIGWKAALGKRSHLHMHDLQWSKSQRVGRLLAALGPVPHAAGLQAVYSAVAASDYDDLLLAGTMTERLLKSYMFALTGLVHLIAQNIPPEETFKLVLEDNRTYELSVRGVFEGNRGLVTPNGHQKLVSIEQVAKGVTSLTEPADYLAYALLQQHRNPGSERQILCSPILKNTRPALGRNHQQQANLMRELVGHTIQRHPHLLRKTSETDNGI